MAAGFEEFESSRAYAGAPLAATRSPDVPVGPDPGRYVPSRPPATRRSDMQPAVSAEADLYAQSAAMARSGQNDMAKFVIMDLPVYDMQLTRAVRENDVEAVSNLVTKVDGFISEHYNGLAGWTGLASAGKEGETAAARLASYLDGTYKDRLGVRDLLDGATEDYKVRKASRLSQELSVDSAAARATFDRDDPMYSVYSRFSDLTSPASAGGPSRPPVPGQMTRESKADFLRGVARLKDSGVAFADAGSMSKFVAAFDQSVNKDGAYAGDAVLEKVARGFLAGGHGLTEHDYVSRYGALVDRLSEQSTGGQSAKGVTPAERRMARHEANAIASAFVAKAGELGVSGLGPEWASSLESAASTVRMANDMFGVAVRGGTGYADRVASAALASMGVAGADDGGMSRLVSDAASDLSTLVSAPTRELMSVLADGKGQAHVGTVKVQNPYSNVEMFAVKALGRAMSALSDGVDGAMPSGRGWGALKRFAAGNESARLGLKRAVADALDTRFGDREVSLRVADGMVDRFLGRSDDGRTIEERLRGYTGLFDPATDRPEIPAAVRLGTNMSDTEFNGAMAAMARNPSAVIPTLKGDRELSSALSEFARETTDRTAQGKDVYSSHKWNKMLGNLADKVGASDSAGIVKAGWLMDFSRKGKARNFEDKDIRFLEKAITRLAENVSARPDASVNDAVMLAVLARGPGWKGFLTQLESKDSQSLRMSSFGSEFDGWARIGRSRSDALSELVDSALAKVGVGKHVSLGTALAALSADPSYASAPLVSLGLVTKGDTPLDYKNFLAKLQQNAYADAYTDKQDDPTPLQEAARRIYRSFGTRDDVIGKLKSDVLEHFRADGAEEAELIRLDRLASEQLTNEYRNGGPAAAEKLARERMLLSRRFLPVIDAKNRRIDPNNVRVSELMTDDEHKAEIARMQDIAHGMGLDPALYSDAVFFNANARGLATYRHNVAMGERVKMGQLLALAKQGEAPEQ